MVIVALIRDVLQNPWQMTLSALGVAAGVSLVVGVDIANESAMSEFRRAENVMSGAATHRIIGATGALDESIYRIVRVQAGILSATPVIRIAVTVRGSEQHFTLMGIDPMSDFRLRNHRFDRHDELAEPQQEGNIVWPLYGPEGLPQTQPGWVEIEYGDRIEVFQRVGTLAIPSQTASRTLVTDISWAQDLAAMQGLISYIDLHPAPGDLQRLGALLPERAQLIALGIHHGAREDMSRAFRVNLTALSLLALVVAMFLVYSAISFQIVRRRRLLGLLGTVGVSSRQLCLFLWLELAVLGMAGTVCGIALGAGLANWLTALVGDTINRLYHALANPIPTLGYWTALKALVAGMGSAALAGSVPILSVVRQSPIVLLAETTSSRNWPRPLLWLAPGAVVLATALVMWPGESLLMPFAGLFIVICGLSLLAPFVLYQSAHIAAWMGAVNRLLVVKMALANASRHLRRTGVAVAALSVAVATALGVELMIGSFRYSVEDWLEHYLRADVYLATSASDNQYLTEPLLKDLRALPGLRELASGHRLTLETDHGPLTVSSLDVSKQGFDGFRIIDGETEGLWRRFHAGGQVLISEPLAHRLQRSVGEAIEMPTDRGIKPFQIAAIYRDYSSDRGLVTMHRQTWNRFFNESRQTSAALYLSPGSDVAQAIEWIRQKSTAPAGLFIRSNRDLRRESLRVFDRTFQVTSVLRWLALSVAVIGIFSSLMALLIERRREFALLSAIGFCRRQIGALFVLEAGLVGLIAGLVAVPLGLLLSLILIHVINVRSFGWSMESRIDWNLLWQAVVLSVMAAVAAACYPVCRLPKSYVATGR